MKNKFILFACLSLFFCKKITAQVSNIDFAPLQPQAAELYKQASHNVSPLTGVPSINVPIYTDPIHPEINIQLNYDASGIKVNQVSTWIGLGWSLNVSGMISRTVRGLPDETGGGDGWISDPMSVDAINNSNTYDTRVKYADLLKDGQPDNFFLSIPGRNVSFSYRKSKGKFETMTSDPIKIEWINSSVQNSSTFKVIDEYGRQFFFDRRDAFLNNNVEMIGVPQSLRSYNQTWHLTSLVSANKKDTIYYEYERFNAQNYLIQKTEVQSYVDNAYYLGSGSTQYYPLYYKLGATTQRHVFDYNESLVKEIRYKDTRIKFYVNTNRRDFGKQLDSIVVMNNNNRIHRFDFSYDYFKSVNNPTRSYELRLKLLSIAKVDVRTGERSFEHSFKYNETSNLPATDATSADYWGYYNGSHSGLLPAVKPMHEALKFSHNANIGYADRNASEQGALLWMLRQIKLPSGGHTDYKFESHKYKSEVSNLTRVDIMPHFKITGNSMSRPVTYTDEFVVPQNLEQNGICRLIIEMSPHVGGGPFGLEDVQQIRIIDLVENRTIASYNHTTNFNTSRNIDVQLYLTVGRRYRVVAQVRSDPSVSKPVFLTASIFADATVTQEISRSGGGARIRDIISADPDGAITQIERYSYPMGEFLRGDRDVQNSVVERDQFVVNQQCAAVNYCFNCWVQTKMISYYGQLELPMITLEGSSVLYGKITKELLANDGSQNGKVELSRSYSSTGQNSIYNPLVPGRREFINNFMIAAQLPSESYYLFDTKTGRYRLTKTKMHDYNLISFNYEPAILIYRRYFYDHTSCTTTGTVFNVNDFSQTNYNIYFGGFKIISTKETDYDKDENPILTNTVSYAYDNPVHMQATRVIEESSSGDSKTHYITYPSDYKSSTGFTYQMHNNNLLAYPVELVTAKGFDVKKIIQGSLSVFKDNATPELNKSFSLKLNSPILSSQFKLSNQQIGNYPPVSGSTGFEFSNLYEENTVFLNYDRFGNPTEIKKRKEPVTVYLWGYEGQYPIAKIENASYAEVLGILGQTTITNLEALNVSELTINTQIQNLRNTLTKSQVTTYTYSPLIGMTSMTDPRGQTEHYEYDGFQRLKEVLDFQRNVLTDYQYHYKP